ncbi:hypothetical protein PN36_01890 [Candidatus Thiomargarita nelsonii]|uniref:Uncharacterized protein n=1 Tax=Candidatus Thiomargarita nelsonii TaxID=1003181 RepID=A0A0A6PKA2_9GAMM|nr:hypothetical protein PN36_01890 [Candidatus Thiomargarita nelsonii]
MATVNFSVPEEVFDAFNDMFRGKNKSAIISDLMMRAVKEEKTRRKRVQAIDALLALRESIPPINTQKIWAARREVRS